VTCIKIFIEDDDQQRKLMRPSLYQQQQYWTYATKNITNLWKY